MGSSRGVNDDDTDKPRSEEVPSASDLRERLHVEHCDNYVYRGQVKRYPTHKCHNALYGEIDVENIYPNDYRFITQYSGTGPELGDRVTAARKKGRDTRDRFECFVFGRAYGSFLSGDPQFAWFEPHLKDFQRLRMLIGETLERATNEELISLSKIVDPRKMPLERATWSLAQHYCVATALVDITFDPETAIWFATNEWKRRKPRPTKGTGVVYRFDRKKIETVLDVNTVVSRLWASGEGLARPPAFFLEDIRWLPSNFAARPQGQSGGSIYGLDNSVAIYLAEKFGALEIFQFRHSENTPDLKITREMIMPEEDPFLPILTEFRALPDVATA